MSALAATPPAPSPSLAEPPDLYTLLAQFTALRHEVNLQTKATRGQQEQNGETLRQLAQALDALEQAQADAEQVRQANVDERLRPLLKALIDLHDAVSLAGREMTRVQDTVLPLLAHLVDALPTEEPPLELNVELPPSPPAPGLFRWFRTPTPDLDALKKRLVAQLQQRRDQQHERFRKAKDSMERVQQLLASLATGYTMSLQRVERTLRQHGLEPIAAAGQPFDPERMEVVEAVTGSGQPSGVVLSEVRRGYLWNGRVFRFAQVRVAKS